MLPMLLLLGLGALLLVSKDSKPALGLAQTPASEDAVIDKSSGFKVYRPDVRTVLVESLRTKRIGKTLNPDLFEIHETKEIVPDGQSAYTAARLVHANGKSIWVSPTLLNPETKVRYILSTNAPSSGGPTTPPPGIDVAMLVSYLDPWPDIQKEVAPPLPEYEPPPIPAPPY